MAKTIVLNKPIGITPLQLIEEFKRENVEYKDKKLGYAGRLDPMAEGLLLVLVGEENKKRKEYERLFKEYEFEALFGVSTDTYDLMGKITFFNPVLPHKSKFLFTLSQVEGRKLEQKIKKKYKGETLQNYPAFSSPRINGKPLFWWARENRLNEIEIPSKRIMIYDLRFKDSYQINSKDLLEIIHQRIRKVKGDFRQNEILKIWDEKIKEKDLKFLIAKFKIKCSSGTYVRSIANEIGKDLRVGALAFSIKRTKIGEFKL